MSNEELSWADDGSFEVELSEYLATLPTTAELDLDGLSERFPGRREKLEELVPVLAAIRDAFVGAGRVSERIEAQFGEGADSRLSLDEVDEGDEQEAPTELLERLRSLVPDEERYRPLGEVARGGMGVVFRVWDVDLRRRLAMKVLLPPRTEPPVAPSERTRMLSRFLEEAQITGQLDHPGVVPVHELGIDPRGRVYFTMRLVRGHELRKILKWVKDERSDWNQTRALGVLLKVCETLAYAHAKGVIHRDLKPANIMVGRFGEVYVMDWGLARVLGREDAHNPQLDETPESLSAIVTERKDARDAHPETSLVTLDGSVIGTPSYMPPEQALGQAELLDRRSDVYAVGAMLYELLVGRAPYQPAGGTLSARTILLAVATGSPPPLQTLAPGSPPELVAICEKAMGRERDERYADTLLMAEDLRAYLENRVVGAHRTGALVEFRKWVQRNRGTAWASAAALFLLIGGLLVSTRFFAQAAKSARDVLSLAASERVQQLREEADQLWPVDPGMADAYEEWLARAQSLTADQSKFRGHLDAVRDRGAQNAAGAWTFDNSEDAWWHRQLEDLLTDFEGFTDPDGGYVEGLVPGAGWGVGRRAELARELARRSTTGPDVGPLWAQAMESAEDPTGPYGPDGVVLRPQLGLVPLGEDPESGLLEFVHVLTGDVPTRDPETRDLLLDASHGVVMVLIPGGEFLQGAQNLDKEAPGYESMAEPDEGPPAVLTVEPFLMAKHELTQAQWERLDGQDPSVYQEAVASMHPVENIDWNAASAVLGRVGMILPEESWWEYAAGAGAETPWWTGHLEKHLQGAANLASEAAAREGANWAKHRAWYVDGHVVHAPAPALNPNPFGLHHVHGNVWEWCADAYAPYGQEVTGDVVERVFRGGSFVDSGSAARLANRNQASPEHASQNLGVRPARRLD